MTTTTTFTIYLPNDKVKYLKKEFNEDKMIILSEGDEHTEIELKFNSETDMIKLFFAGVNAGINMSREFFK